MIDDELEEIFWGVMGLSALFVSSSQVAFIIVVVIIIIIIKIAIIMLSFMNFMSLFIVLSRNLSFILCFNFGIIYLYFHFIIQDIYPKYR